MAVLELEVNGVPVTVERTEGPDPVVFVHARPFGCWYQPLIDRLAGRGTVLVRRPVSGPGTVSIGRDADLTATVLQRLGIDRPHVVGHSYGGLVALELARRRRVDVRSLALLEPATAGLLEPDEAAARFAPILALASDHGTAAAMEAFLVAVCGSAGRDAIDRFVPGATAEALAHADGFFAAELPAVIAWSFGTEDAAAIEAPVLNVRGGDSEPRFHESATIVHGWFPAAAPLVVEGATHVLMAQQPQATAELLESFWAST